MERFFILDKFNTWYDWSLVLTGKDITPPEPNTNYVKIDGMSGTLDLSESLTGEVTYQDRTITATFWTDKGTHKERSTLIRKILTALHGKKIKIIEPDDPDNYFYGRVKVKAIANTLPYLEFEIEAVCEPWRYAINETERSVDSGIVTTALVINNNGAKTLSPDIIVTGNINIRFTKSNGEIGVKVLQDGEYKYSDLKLYPGVNVMHVSGKGSATFRYREADL